MIRVHCKVEMTFEKGNVQETYHTSFYSDFLEERPLGMVCLWTNERLEYLFSFILRKLGKLLPDKESYVVEDAMYGVLEKENETDSESD